MELILTDCWFVLTLQSAVCCTSAGLEAAVQVSSRRAR